MPSASISQCVECQLQPSKYTCPKCSAKTCSLACTKAHNAPSSTTCASSSSSSRDAKTPTAIKGAAVPSASTASPSDYVPMSKYTEANMLQDYLFLSSLSRTTAEKGREIVRMNLLPPPTTGTNDNSHPSNSNTRLTNQQRQRDQLMKQIHYRKYKIMLLPDGMARRKLNQTNWSPKDRKMTFTVQLTFPTSGTVCSAQDSADAKQKLSSDEAFVVHKADADWCVHRLVLGEIERHCFPNRKELMRQRELLGVPLPPLKAVVGEGESPAWIVSRSFVEQHLGLTLQSDGQDSTDGDVVVLDGLPEHWQVLVPVYSSRLTNESTVKYLEWWNRKRKWEEANPELQSVEQHTPAGPHQQESAPHEAKKQRVWGAQKASVQGESAISDEVVPQQPIVEAMAPPAMPSIISSSLLAMLSQRLGRNAPPPSALATALLDEELNAENGTKASAKTSLVDTKDATSAKPQAERHLSTLIHIVDADTTIHDLLARAIPDGFSVVEFPVFEIRDSRKSQSKSDEVVITHPVTTPRKVAEDHSETNSVSDKAEVQPASPSLPEQAAVIANNALPPPLQGLVSFLGGYASDSDDDA